MSEKNNITLKSLEDLEKCEWNGIFVPPFAYVRIFNLRASGIHFMDYNELSMQIVSVCANMSNFDVLGRTFETDSCTKMEKYEGENDEIYFLQGLYLDNKKEPSYYLEFLEYKKGQKHPQGKSFKISKNNISIL